MTKERIEEIKNSVAHHHRKPNWSELLYWESSSGGFNNPKAIDDLVIRCVNEALDEAARIAMGNMLPKTSEQILNLKVK